MIKTIGFDADDTLWHNERIFLSVKAEFSQMLAAYHETHYVARHLDVTEAKNIRHFGYGIKGFTLSMIETACELTEGRISGRDIEKIISLGKEMLAAPIEVLEDVRPTLVELARDYRLIVITKGDLLDQETKVARSGLGDLFAAVEVVARKTRQEYERIYRRHAIVASEFVMVGNSLRSDILPVLESGGNAVHVPYETEWFHEAVPDDELVGLDFGRITELTQLPAWLRENANRISKTKEPE